VLCGFEGVFCKNHKICKTPKIEKKR